jgi:hypothetical protein
VPRGGRRSGAPGVTYPERTDLNQAVRTVPGQPYGQAGAQQAAQQAIPQPQTPVVQASPAPTAAPFAAPESGMLHAPTARPDEPVTAGLPVGAGPGPEALGALGRPDDQVLANLYAAYRTAPTEGLRQLIQTTEQLRGRSL